MINKELLSEVLECNATPDRFLGSTLWYDYEDDRSETINIYELAHKCKEWAYNKKLLIRSSCDGFVTVSENINDYNRVDFKFSADTKPEAIFKACQWILDNKDQK